MLRSLLKAAPAIADGVLAAVVEQYRILVRRPGGVVPIIVGNAVLMGAGWFLLPPRLQAWLFALHGPLAFPIVLAAWMIADTPATNVLADQGVGTQVLAGPAECRQWLAARSAALGLLVAVPCSVIALVLGGVFEQWSETILACLAIVVAPFGVLPLVAWLGLLHPYRPQPLAWRWGHRRVWPTQMRWLLLVLAPYVVVPLVSVALVLPGLAVELAVAGRTLDLRPSQVVLVGLTLVVTMLVAGLAGLAGAASIAERQRVRIARFLADPHAG